MTPRRATGDLKALQEANTSSGSSLRVSAQDSARPLQGHRSHSWSELRSCMLWGIAKKINLK